MQKGYAAKNLITSLFATVLLLHFMEKSPSPKIIFIPFLICSLSMVGKSLARIMNKEKVEFIFGKIFTLGFLLFFVGFLIIAGYTSVRDKNYSLLIFSIPFWIVGIYLVKSRLLNKNEENSEKSFFAFAFVISALLVVVALLAGIFLLGYGIKEAEFGVILAGVIFTFGSFAFVLAALTVKGCFDKVKIDVLGLYAGVIVVVIGIGFLLLMCKEPASTYGLWIIIPILMIVAGIYKIIKLCV